jgi:hypothetical protein
VAEYNDIPEGFTLASAGGAAPGNFSDLPEGFSVSPQEAPQQEPLSFLQRVKREMGLGARMVSEGTMDVVAPFADATGYLLNQPLRAYDALRSPSMSELITGKKESFRFPTNHSGEFSQTLTNAGLPEPQGGFEKAGNIVGRMATGAVASAPLTSAVMARLGFAPKAVNAPQVQKAPPAAPNPAAQTLQEAGVRLDQGQRTGGRFMQMLRSAVTNHPLTAGKQAEFGAAQQKDFNRAVLRSIGANADEATQTVMLAAKQRIGAIFNSIGSKGATFDDALQTELSTVMDDALRTVPQNSLQPVQRNVDDILNAVGKDGKINGETFIKIRSHLSELSDNADVGQVADRLESALISALERTHPGQKKLLADAVDQWRSMRIIQTAIGKGAERNISPLALSNAIGSRANQAMSVYGQGGDQGLVALAQAGRDVLPQVLPDSGSIPRGLMQAPLHAIASSPLYKAGQLALNAQPRNALATVPGYGVRLPNALAPAAVAGNALREPR